jgi:hypothetical protein
MPDDSGAGRMRVVGRGIGGAVVDHHHRIARTFDLGHDAGKHRPFVVGRNDHIDLRPRDNFHLTLPRHGTNKNSQSPGKFRLRQQAARGGSARSGRA